MNNTPLAPSIAVARLQQELARLADVDTAPFPSDDPRWESYAGRRLADASVELARLAETFPSEYGRWIALPEGARAANVHDGYVWDKLGTQSRIIAKMTAAMAALPAGAYTGPNPLRMPAPTLKRDAKGRIALVASQFLRGEIRLQYGAGAAEAWTLEVRGVAGLARLKEVEAAARANPLVGFIATHLVYGDESRYLADGEYAAWWGESASGPFGAGYVESDDPATWLSADLRGVSRDVKVRRAADEATHALHRRWFAAGWPLDWLGNGAPAE